MKIKIWVTVFFLLLASSLYSVNYITTAKSISWNGAYTSVADGFEAMLYNPAGLYFSSTKYGLNILGTYGVRVYSNSISTDDILKIFYTTYLGKNLTTSGVLGKILGAMPALGLDAGIDLSVGNIMTYMKFKNFSMGFSFIPRTYVTAVIDKSLFNTVFNELDLTKPLSLGLKVTAVQYLDLNIQMSTRAKFLEKVIPVKGIFVGFATHFYYPTLYTRTASSVLLNAGAPNSLGFVDNYIFRLRGNIIMGGNAGSVAILKAATQGLDPEYQYFDAVTKYGGSAAFGLGFDMGFMVEFNNMFRLGFAATDLGFIVFPQTAVISMDVTADLNMSNINAFRDDIVQGVMDTFLSGNGSASTTTVIMPGTAIRLGIAFTPFKNGWLTLAADISLSDLNRLAQQEYPTFNFSTGIEFMPGYKWFAVPIRAAFNYNTQSNAASFSLGMGLYLGPVEMEFGVKGLELLINNWGAKEISVGADLKFEF